LEYQSDKEATRTRIAPIPPANAYERPLEGSGVVYVLEQLAATPDGKLKTLVITAGSQKLFDGPCLGSCAFRSVEGYLIPMTEFANVPHGALVMVSVTTESGTQVQTYFRNKRTVSLSGIAAPVLMRMSGSAAGFSFENLAPSVAGGVQFNSNSRRFPFVAVDALLTVFALPETDRYSLSFGPVVDLSGYLQVGTTYHARDKKWFLVLGTRPEVLARLFPKASTQP
jgi:hypothetical protein